MKRPFLFAVFYFLLLSATAQLTRIPVSVVYPSLHTYSTQFKDAFSFRSNSAALAGIKQFSAGLFSERRFLLQELTSYSFAAALPTSSGNFGVKGDYAGSQSYNETALGFAYGRKLSDKLNVGVEFSYFSQQAAGYGSASALTFGAGALLQLTETVQTGLHVYNPIGMAVGKAGGEKLPAVYSAGIGYDVSPKIFIGAEVIKTEEQPVGVNAGLHYLIADKLVVRGGISTGTSTYFLGFGVQMKAIRVDVTASFHPYLGTTPGLLLVYSRGK